MKRFRFSARRSARYGGVLATIAFVALTMFVVLPAFASNTGDQVPPPSAAGVLPVDAPVGGSQNCQTLFPDMAGVQTAFDPSPPQKGSATWPGGPGWNFTLTSGALPGFQANKGQSLKVDSGGHAAILGIGIKGGTDNLIYDYRKTNQGWVYMDSNLHAPAQNWTAGTNPETGITQYYGVSQLVICYKTPLAAISGNAYKAISGNPGIGGLTVTINDTTPGDLGTHTTTTDASGNYSFPGIPGDAYTVCIQAPTTFTNTQTDPAGDGTNGACTLGAGNAPKGYSIASLPANGASGKNFGFQPLGTVGGTVYQDINGPKDGGPDGHFEAALDTPLSGWTVKLYDGSNNLVGAPTTTDANGQYSFMTAFDTSQTYTLCVTPTPPPPAAWGQSEPLPTAANSCAALGGLLKGQQFTPATPSASVTENFGVDPAVEEGTCPPPTPFGFDNTGAGGSELQIQLADCKPNQTFVFNFAPGPPADPNGPWVSVWASDQTQPKVPLIEHIVFPDPIVNGKPTFEHLSYTDTFPYDPTAAERMAFCQKDPRVPGPGDPSGLMTLPQGFSDQVFQTDVLPATNVGTQTPATTCLISLRTFVDANGDGWMEAYAATDIDGLTRGTN